MKKYMCLICGHIYDEAVGDPDTGIPPGTKWEDVPPNWTCPDCGARKEDTSSSAARSEEHTSELQSPDHLVCRLLLEKKKKSSDQNSVASAPGSMCRTMM